MVQACVRQKTETRAHGDWPFRQLKATPPCGTVTALTRTEFSLTFSGIQLGQPSRFLVAGAILAGRNNYEGWNGFNSRTSSSRAYPRGRICQPEIDPALTECAGSTH